MEGYFSAVRPKLKGPHPIFTHQIIIIIIFIIILFDFILAGQER